MFVVSQLPLLALLMPIPDEEVTGGALEQSVSGASAWYHPMQFHSLR